MKKRYCGGLLIALSVLLLSACGNSEGASSGDNGKEETGGEPMKELIIGVGGQQFRAGRTSIKSPKYRPHPDRRSYAVWFRLSGSLFRGFQ